MKERKVLSTENYQYMLDEQRRQKIQADVARDRLVAQLPRRQTHNLFVTVLQFVGLVLSLAAKMIVRAAAEAIHTLGHFLVWLGHHLEKIAHPAGGRPKHS